MNAIKKILSVIAAPPKKLWTAITREIRYRKRMRELRKRDPFIY